MGALSEYINLGLGGLFLKEETYEKMRQEPNPLVKGLGLVVLVGGVVALFALVGQVLEWTTTPDLSNLKNIVLEEMQKTQWFRQMARNPRALEGFRQGYDLWWQIFGGMFGVNILGAVFNIVLNPIALLLQWLIYGFLVFLFARVLGGQGSLSQTLGCTALAVTPQMLGIVQVVPYAELGGLTIWALVCTYVGIKISGQLSPWRAFWATILPFIALVVLAILVGCMGGFAVGSLMSGGTR